MSTKIMSDLKDAIVIGSNGDLIEEFAMLSPFPNVLDEGLSCNEVKRFPGEASRTPASWDYAKSMIISR
jgi:hypothetical protein